MAHDEKWIRQWCAYHNIDRAAITDIREYAENYPVSVRPQPGEQANEPRLVLTAFNEGGYNCTEVDLLDVIVWVKKHRPELLGDTQ